MSIDLSKTIEKEISFCIKYQESMSVWYCYLLVSEDRSRTYIGATVSPDHRLRQHNGELVGGAKATSGRSWIRAALVSQFPDATAALQFEWAWKFRSRKYGSGLRARMLGLKDLLESPQSTSKAVAFSDWPTGGPVVWKESDVLNPYSDWIPFVD